MTVNFVVADVNNEVLSLQATADVMGGGLQVCRAKVEAYKAWVEALDKQIKVYKAIVANSRSVYHTKDEYIQLFSLPW